MQKPHGPWLLGCAAAALGAAAWASCRQEEAAAPLTIASAAAAFTLESAAPVEPLREPLRYDRDVRPILSDRCFKCHGPDAASRQAELRLDSFEGATADRGGYAAIVPGDAEASELWLRVGHADPGEKMPPATANKKSLSADERALVRRWIEEGAEYEPHWSFTPPARPSLPAVLDTAWAENEIDLFVLSELEARGLAPSPEAAPQTLLRRLFLDLTGLPPTIDELDRFLTDTRPDAYERWVETLLHEEPYQTRYAERMATPWLDAARYADTSGIHMDAGRQIWPWRDWVLGAFRDGMPFDRFVTEQLAGDLLPDATDAQRIASGFNRNHVTSDEGGAINEEYLVEYAVDRTATTGSVFLGLTLGCARCHEHKFDPISQQEFYGLYSFFNSNEEPGIYTQVPDANRALEPFMVVNAPEKLAELERLGAELELERGLLDAPAPEEEGERTQFLATLALETGIQWARCRVVDARSVEGASLAIEADGAVFASGTNPDTDDHVITLRTEETGLSLLALEALADARLPEARVGRSENGNAVLSAVTAEAVSLSDPTRRKSLRFNWAWADTEQADGDFVVANALDSDGLGWAVGAHQKEGSRAALFRADEPFGFEGGTEIVVTLAYRSMYARHVFGRVRLSLASIGDAGSDRLPTGASSWYLVGPFDASSGALAFETAFGPEVEGLGFTKGFGAGLQAWRYAGHFDGRLNSGLPEGVNASYASKRLFVPNPRTLDVALGSDDGARIFLDGREVFARQVDRSLSADQDRFALELTAGEHELVFKIVNSGGQAGFYWRAERRPAELAGDLALALLPERSREGEFGVRFDRAWRIAFSPGYLERTKKITELETALADGEAALPKTMVMAELAIPRETFLLMRGQYDHPDPNQRVERGVPAALGAFPEGAPMNRLGLAQWLCGEENPLVARVAVNRIWELVFGTGIVRTSEDFGHQGEWPSHPELLDWLAVEFRESGWDVKAMLARLVTSSTYRQSARVRPEVQASDPEDRLLAWFPRKRLTAEAIRDQALYVSGLLVERLGGPSVKPYQPADLWQEIAMPQSNTRLYERGGTEELWRRSLYTYWKRACPPPSLLTLDAPTREFCTIRRPTTNTPLQALVLWNDEQFVEAARVLAQRILAGAGDDRARMIELFRRCTSHAPDAQELELLSATLARLRERYRAAPEDAVRFVEVGEAPLAAEIDPVELAAWTLVTNAVLNLDATLTRS